MINLARRLEFWAGLKPNDVAFVDGKREITYAELKIHTLKVATVLESLGVKRGELVCTVLPPYLDWPIILALHLLGATSFAKPSLTNFDIYADPNWLITASEHPDFSRENTLIVDQGFAEKVNDAKPYECAANILGDSTPIRLSSTSGTSGEIKYLSFTESELYPRLLSPSVVNFAGNGKFLNFMLFGAAQSYNWAMRSLIEGKVNFISRTKDEGIFEMLTKYEIKTLYGSPQQISTALETIERLGKKLDKSFTVVLGGSAPSPKLIEKIRANHDCEIINSHGSAETGFISAVNLTKENSHGLIIHPNSIVEVLGEDESILGPDDVGVLRYKIPAASTSYFNNPEATKKNFKDGYFYSGDMGYKAEDGRLFITGRSNEVINLGGVKVNPEQVDLLALDESGIQDVASFSLDNESGVPKLAIAVVVNHEFNESNFIANMKLKFPRARVERVFKVNAIPRNPNGKILRRELNLKFSNL